jgi:hypothetical protein
LLVMSCRAAAGLCLPMQCVQSRDQLNFIDWPEFWHLHVGFCLENANCEIRKRYCSSTSRRSSQVHYKYVCVCVCVFVSETAVILLFCISWIYLRIQYNTHACACMHALFTCASVIRVHEQGERTAHPRALAPWRSVGPPEACRAVDTRHARRPPGSLNLRSGPDHVRGLSVDLLHILLHPQDRVGNELGERVGPRFHLVLPFVGPASTRPGASANRQAATQKLH